jgi:hypothetical protein
MQTILDGCVMYCTWMAFMQTKNKHRNVTWLFTVQKNSRTDLLQTRWSEDSPFDKRPFHPPKNEPEGFAFHLKWGMSRHLFWFADVISFETRHALQIWDGYKQNVIYPKSWLFIFIAWTTEIVVIQTVRMVLSDPGFLVGLFFYSEDEGVGFQWATRLDI